MSLGQVSILVLAAPALTWGLQLLPPTFNNETSTSARSWNLPSNNLTIWIERELADTKDDDGLTLIPPSGLEFAQLFAEDLSSVTGDKYTVRVVDDIPQSYDDIALGTYTGDDQLAYENGQLTTEGYELIVADSGAFIGGTGARGMWWGTRTLLQQLLLGDGISLPIGRSVDAPAYATRGFMLDAGRKWYTKDFLKEMCSFASFFKMSEFHYHLSDNYPLNRGKNATWQDVYSHFSLLPEDPDLLGIIHGRENETLNRADYADLQSHCAARGVAVVPEIEAPGHCLYLTKVWPELSLPKRDLLNLSHPETVPTVKRIWAEFLPWFDVKEVHIGADEYDPTLSDEYINFVNDMSNFINTTSGKRTRIWGTPMDPPTEPITISKDIIIQHWQYGQSDPVQLVEDGYSIINSEDWYAYMGMKNDHMPILPARYPQAFNESRVLNFANEEGWQWQPADYNPFNVTMQLEDEQELNKGAIIAAWNDNGPDSSTQLEAYYTMRRGIALVGARAWSGARGPELVVDTVASSIDFYSPLAPGQNLDRVLRQSDTVFVTASDSSPLLTWSRDELTRRSDNYTYNIGYGSKGMNYTLSLAVTGPFELSSLDVKLVLDIEGQLVFTADGYEYPLRHVDEQSGIMLDPGHPGRIWVNVTDSTHEPVRVNLASQPTNITITTDILHGSLVWVNGAFTGRFEVFIYGGRNTQFSWSQMAFVAPLETVKGTGLESLEIVGSVNFYDPYDSGPPVNLPGRGATPGAVPFVMLLGTVFVTSLTMW